MRHPFSIFKPISHIFPKSRFLSSGIVVEVQTILDYFNPIEDSLEATTPFLSPNVVNSVVKDQRDIQLAFRFFIWAMKRKRFRSWASHNTMIDKLCEEKGFEIAWDLLEKLKVGSFPIVSHVFAVLISAYGKMGLVEKAVETFGKMKAFDCRPNTFTYNTILHILVGKDVLILALAVYNQMLKVDCRPNRATYGILINGLCKAGKPEDARQLFDEMEHRGISPDTMIYTIIISGLCQANKTDDAHKLLHSMKSNSCLPDIITYNALLSGFCKLNKIDESLKLLDSFRKEGYVLGLNGYSCLIDGLFRVGRFDEACEWYRMMLKEDIVPDCKLYTVLIKGFTRVGRVEEALNFLSEMSQKGVVPDTFCYNTLIQGFCDVGLLDKARSLKLEISTNNCFPDSATYTILICGLCKEGLVGEAKQIFNDMENIGCLPTVMTFNALIDGLCKAGELEDARLLFYKMEIGRNPSLFLRLSQGADRVLDSESLHKMVDQLCKSGLMLKAYKLLRQLADSGVVPNITTYNILINGLCKAGKIDGALKLVYDLQVKGYNPDVVTYATLIDGYQRANREEAALRLFNQMEKLGCTPSLIIYNTLMTYMCRKGKLSQAFSLWLKYLRGLPDRDNGDLTVVEKKFERGEIEAAVRGLLEIDMKYNAVEPALYTVWLIGLCQAGKLDEAWKVFNVLEDGKIDATPPSCVILINGLCGAQKVDLAVNVMLYTLEKGFKLMQPVCNRLMRFLYSQDNAMGVLDLVSRMSSAGYDVDAYLYHSSKVIVNRCMQRQEIRKRALVI